MTFQSVACLWLGQQAVVAVAAVAVVVVAAVPHVLGKTQTAPAGSQAVLCSHCEKSLLT